MLVVGSQGYGPLGYCTWMGADREWGAVADRVQCFVMTSVMASRSSSVPKGFRRKGLR